MEQEVQSLLSNVKVQSFEDDSMINTISKIENLLATNHVSKNLGIEAAAVLGYFYGKTHRYDKAQKWLKKVPCDEDDQSWGVFKDILVPLFSGNKKEEKKTIASLKQRLDNLLKRDSLHIENVLFLDHSFWYAYLNTNPRILYEKYTRLQMNVYPQLAAFDYSETKENGSHRIKLGIISNGLLPETSLSLNPMNIHSSSISDSFYSTFLNMSSDMFEVIFIYYNQKQPFPKDPNDKNMYINALEPTASSILKTQRRIADLELDILLFLDLHIEPALNWIALSKLAKIQMCTHGHPVTSGIPRDVMNYFVSWEAAESKNGQEYYTEELLLIPKDVMWEVFVPRNNEASVSMLTGIPWGHITRNDLNETLGPIDVDSNWYFSAQAVFKFNYKFDFILKGIQEKDPSAFIIIIRNDGQLSAMNGFLKRRLEKNGVDMGKIIFVDKMPHHIMMAVYNNVDVVLDSYFFGGDTTTREAFEVGAPVITLPHKYLGTRWTQAYYTHIGITDLIAKNIEDYVNLAVYVAGDKEYSSKMRQKIKKNSAKLFHSKHASLAWGVVFKDVYDKFLDRDQDQDQDQGQYRPNNIILKAPDSKETALGGSELMLQRINDLLDSSKFNIVTNAGSSEIDPNKATIYWCHDLPNDPMYEDVDKKNTFVFVSEYQRKCFLKTMDLNPKRCHVIHNGIYPTEPHKKNKSICRLIYHSTPNRGLDVLVTVFEKLVPMFWRNGINVHLDVYSSFKLYGRKDLDTHFTEIFNKIVEHPNMTYYGTVSNDEIREALKLSHILAFPSTYPETSCLCLIEAMSAGCICVHSSLAALPETANGHTMMYEYSDDQIEHCTIFAETLMKSVFMFRKVSLQPQIDYVNTTFHVDRARKQWKDLLNSGS